MKGIVLAGGSGMRFRLAGYGYARFPVGSIDFHWSLGETSGIEGSLPEHHPALHLIYIIGVGWVVLFYRIACIWAKIFRSISHFFARIICANIHFFARINKRFTHFFARMSKKHLRFRIRMALTTSRRDTTCQQGRMTHKSPRMRGNGREEHKNSAEWWRNWKKMPNFATW